MAKAKKAAPVKARYETAAGHGYEFVLCVTDELTVKLREIRHLENGTWFVYDYIEEFSPLGHKSTKYGTEMVLNFETLEENFRKGIFKTIKQTNA